MVFACVLRKCYFTKVHFEMCKNPFNSVLIISELEWHRELEWYTCVRGAIHRNKYITLSRNRHKTRENKIHKKEEKTEANQSAGRRRGTPARDAKPVDSGALWEREKRAKSPYPTTPSRRSTPLNMYCCVLTTRGRWRGPSLRPRSPRTAPATSPRCRPSARRQRRPRAAWSRPSRRASSRRARRIAASPGPAHTQV